MQTRIENLILKFMESINQAEFQLLLKNIDACYDSCENAGKYLLKMKSAKCSAELLEQCHLQISVLKRKLNNIMIKKVKENTN